MKDIKPSINICFQQNPITVDPRKSGEQYSSTLIFLLFDGLMKSLPDETVVPSIAESYEISKDRKTYTFHIRDANWSDGTPITAKDFEYSWKTALSHTFPCLNAQLFYPIKNAKKIVSGELKPSQLGVSAINERTLVVELERPTPYFLKLTCFCNYYPIPSHIAQKNEIWDHDYESLVTNGAYTLEEFIPHHHLQLTKNERYWNKKNVNAENLSIQIIHDPETALYLFEKKKIHWMGAVLSPIPDFAIEKYRKTAKFDVIPKPGSIFITFNTQSFPFKSSHIRKAFSCAISREELAKISKGSLDSPARRLLPAQLIQTEAPLIDPVDPEKAKELFKLGEIELGEKIAQVTFFYQGNTNRDLSLYLQSKWEKTFGIKVHLKQFEYKTFLSRLRGKEYQAALYGCLAQIGDPIDILDRYKYAGNSKNYPGWQDETYISLLDASAIAISEDKRLKLLEEAEKRLISEMPLTPLFHINFSHLSHLDDISYTNNSGIRFENANLQTEEQ